MFINHISKKINSLYEIQIIIKIIAYLTIYKNKIIVKKTNIKL
jgi:hypothetical protein